jgi:hypothetical protein
MAHGPDMHILPLADDPSVLTINASRVSLTPMRQQHRRLRPLGISAESPGVAPRDVGVLPLSSKTGVHLVRRVHLDLVRYLGAVCTPG